MERKAYYQQKIGETGIQLQKLRTKRNGLTLFKIITTLGVIYLVYKFAVTANYLYLQTGVAGIVIFIITNSIESRLLRKMAFLQELKKCSEVETAYLNGDFTSLPTGASFRQPTHPYALDLDLFGDHSLYQSINRTVTSGGEQILREWLLSPCKSALEIKARQEAVAELGKDPDWCHTFRATGQQFHTTNNLLELANKWQQSPVSHFRKLALSLLYIGPILTLSAWILCIFELIPFLLPLYLSLLQLIVVGANMKGINRVHAQLDSFLRSFSNHHELVRLFAEKSYQSNRLQQLHATLFAKEQNAQTATHALHKILEGFDQRGNLLGMAIVNGLYMRDLHLIVRVAQWKTRYAEATPAWIKAISELDALVSLANYHYNHPDHIFPCPESTQLLQGEAIGHPLLPETRCVTNDFQIKHLHEFYIITGANMAGKSTFLRAIGVNLVLAHAGCVVNAKHFAFQPMAIFSSMRTVDNLAKGTSYFHAELLRLKQLIETAHTEERLFIILDEILKGTNSVDKLNGSRRFLEKLLTLPVAGLVATHDLELGKLEITHPGHFINNCFEITHTDDTITYDYKLHPGISQNMNASILLEKMGLV